MSMSEALAIHAAMAAATLLFCGLVEGLAALKGI